MTIPPKKNAPSSAEKPNESSDDVFDAVNVVADQLGAIEKFVARRFDEISMEINATSQQMEISEADTNKRFGEIMQVLAAVSYKGQGDTPANTGAELDAVVDMTEDAANKILDAAGRVNKHIHSDIEWADEEVRARVLEKMNMDIEEIFMACSFQDITGQRIRKALDNIKEIEERLGAALEKFGITPEVVAPDENPEITKATSQDDIDALFSDD